MTRTLLSNALIFDGTGAPISPGDVVLEDDRILDVGVGLDGDVAVDLEGRALLPGLFDCHVHMMISHLDLWRIIHEPFSLPFYEAARNMEVTLATGITTVRDAGGADLGLKEAKERGLVSGPRMQISLSMITQTGGHGDGWLPSDQIVDLLPPHPGRPAVQVDGRDEMRRAVRVLIRAGADVIKVATSGGVLSPRDEPHHAHFSLEELEVLVQEAAAADRWVMAHAQATDGIKNAIRAGIRSIDHGIYLDDESIGLMVENGTFLVPTLIAPTGVLRAAETGVNIPEAALRKARAVIEAHRDSFRRAVDAGVKIAMGTDTGVTPHGENLEELSLMEEGGMSPMDVLAATTIVAAELMGLDADRGTIEPGKRADLVVVDGDPLTFEGLGDRISAVWQDGREVDRRPGSRLVSRWE